MDSQTDSAASTDVRQPSLGLDESALEKGHRALLLDLAKALDEFLKHHQIPVETLARIASVDDMRIRRFISLEWTRGPREDLYDRLLAIRARRPQFWTDELIRLLTAARDYYRPFGL